MTRGTGHENQYRGNAPACEFAEHPHRPQESFAEILTGFLQFVIPTEIQGRSENGLVGRKPVSRRRILTIGEPLSRH